MQELRQSTAINVMFGIFVDDTDGKTAEEALTLAQADLHLSKNGAASAQKNDATSATHRYGGDYSVPLNATDTNTLGCLELICKESGALPIKKSFMVVTQNYWDSKYSTDKLQVDVVQWLGQACHAVSENGVPKVDLDQIGGVVQSLTDFKDLVDTGYDPATHKVQGVVLTDTITTYTGNTKQTANNNTILAHGTYGSSALQVLIAALQTDLDNGADGLGALKTLIDAVPTAAENKTAIEAAGSDLDYMMIALVNKMIVTEANGNTEQFNDANSTLGSIATAYSTDGTFTTRKRMVI